MRLLRQRGDLLPAVAITLTALVVAGLILGRFIFPYATVIGFDEGYMVSFAERLIDGRFLPYVDAVSQRGPILYWVLAVAQMITGRYEWMGIRVVGLTCALLTISATSLSGAAARWPLAGALGGTASVLAIIASDDNLGVFGEGVATPLLAVSFCLLASALCRTGPGKRRTVLLVLAGVFAGLTTATKQTMGVAMVPFAAWTLAHTWSEANPGIDAPGRRLAWCAPTLSFLAGWAAPLAAIVVWYAIHGALRELIYWTSTYNSTIYMLPYRARYGRILAGWLKTHPYAGVGLILTVCLALARLWTSVTWWSARGLGQAYARVGFEVTAALTGVLLFVTALLPARFFRHYFVPVWPWLGIVVGVVIELLVRRGSQASWKRKALAAAGICVALASLGERRIHDINRRRASGSWRNPRPDRICAHIDKYAPPGSSIFVWGFDGDIYITCRRKPAARYTYLTPVAGIVAPLWKKQRPELVAPGSREILLADLEQSRPALILDVPIHGFSITRIPELSALLARDYCPLPKVTGKHRRRAGFYGRRDLGLCSEAPQDASEPSMHDDPEESGGGDSPCEP